MVAHRDFVDGIFCNPLNNHMVIFGSLLGEAFRNEFPDLIVDAHLAAKNER